MTQKALQKALGKRVRELRMQKGWSQRDLARACAIHRSHVGRIENGRVNLTLVMLLAIGSALDTTMSKLFKGFV